MNSILFSLTQQAWKQKIFSYTPRLREVLQDQSEPVLSAFLHWAGSTNLSMEWSLHVHLLNWLTQHLTQQAVLDQVIYKELLTAAAIRWSLSGLDHVHEKGILLYTPELPKQAVGLWKNSEITKTSKIISLSIPHHLEPNQQSFAISNREADWSGISWMPIPT